MAEKKLEGELLEPPPQSLRVKSFPVIALVLRVEHVLSSIMFEILSLKCKNMENILGKNKLASNNSKISNSARNRQKIKFLVVAVPF